MWPLLRRCLAINYYTMTAVDKFSFIIIIFYAFDLDAGFPFPLSLMLH